MTVNELIKELQKISDRGHGEYIVMDFRYEIINAVEENPFKEGYVTLLIDE